MAVEADASKCTTTSAESLLAIAAPDATAGIDMSAVAGALAAAVKK